MVWDIVKAEDFCTGVTDGTHDSPKAVDEGRYLITSKHLSEYEIDFSTAKLISEEDYQKIIKRSTVRQWDILFSMIGTIGNTYLEKNESVDYACKNMGIFQMGGDKEKALWLYFYLKSPQAKEYVFSHLRGSTQQYLPLGGLREFPIPVPDKDMREKIVSVLKSLDDKIENNNQINRNLLEQLKTIFDAWFYDLEPFGGKEPEGTEYIPIEKLCATVTKGTTPTTLGMPFTEEGVNFIKGETILDNHGFDRTKLSYIGEDTHEKLKRSQIESGDIVFTIAGTLGRFALVDDSMVPANTNQAVAIIRAKRVSPEYLYSFFLGNWHNEYYTKRIQQAVQANLSLGTIKSLPIAVLPQKFYEEYLGIINPLIAETKRIETENLKLAELRDSLLPKLMSGEIDVSDLDI